MLRTSRFSTQARDAWIASLVQEAGETACRIRCTPPHAAEADRSDACPQDERVWSVARDAGTVTDHGGAAIGNADATHESILCRGAGLPASVACAGGRSRLPYRLTPPHAAEVSSRCGCRKQPRVARRASRVGWPRDAACSPFGWLGVTRHDQQMVSARGGLLPDRDPKVADAAR